ncbi:hypothetical protein CerSpe_200500 [Prunus speciosa]
MAAANSHQPILVLFTTFVVAAAIVLAPTTCTAQLTRDFYQQSCPNALQIIRSVVNEAINRETRMGASLLRLHFHDCFVNGCDGSILLDDTANFTGEKTAFANLNSVRGFDVIDEIKATLNTYCNGNVVSCADILAVAARDSVEILGGPSYSYEVQLGRRDATTAVLDDANRNLPAPTFDFSQLLSIFQSHGLGLQDLILLSGGHTIGLARCTTFRDRIYNDTNIDPEFAASLREGCPVNGGDNNTTPIDSTTTQFDTVYFKSLLQKKGLFHSDQELFKSDGSDSDNLVQHYANSPEDFKVDFGASMIKMGNINPLTGYAATIVLVPTTCTAQLTSDFYKQSCPQALQIIRSVVKQAINREARMGASLLRLHFHDCFVNGCDGSILLDDTDSFTGEKTAGPNLNSVRGFDVVDDIKAALNRDCHGNVVSCADILAVAARDSVEILGGPSYSYEVLLGRRDATTAVLNDANRNLPAPFFAFSQLLSSFQSHGLDLQDLILLSGGHTIGLARCTTFRARIYNDTNIDPAFAASLQKGCPANGGDDNTAPIDSTTAHFDTVYFKSLLQKKGLFHSDQELFKSDGSDSDNLVQHYANSPQDFKVDFGASMVKMGNIKPLTGSDGEIRLNCRKIN